MTTTAPAARTAPTSFPPVTGLRAAWPQLVCWSAALWSATLAVLGLVWANGVAGYPFGPVAPGRTSGSVLEGLPVAIGAPAMVVVGVLGVVVAVVLATGRLRALRRPLLAVAWVSAVVFVVVVPDYTVIAILAVWPLLIGFAIFGVPGPQEGIGDILFWHRLFVVGVFVGGLLWAAAAVSYSRRTADRCVGCGRGAAASPWDDPQRALRWGRVAVWVAVLSCVPYEATRIAWALGWPLGIPTQFHRLMANTPGMLEMGLGFAVLSMGGAVLTHGLVARWGEVFPRWIPVVRGRPVPPMVAVIPASLVAVALPPAGLMAARVPVTLDSWAIGVPGALWFGWAVGLAVATYAYHLRRRATCRRCGRGAAVATGLVELERYRR